MPTVTKEQFAATTFDYLIVGGGTAGIALASRLSEDPSVLVGVLEAGGHFVQDTDIDTPGFIGRTIGRPEYDWKFLTAPQTRVDDRRIFLPRGKGVGGSSLINFMTSTRPSKEELDAWETLGNPGWNWEVFDRCIKKSETVLDKRPSYSDVESRKFKVAPETSERDSNGPIKKSFPPRYSEINARILETAEALGVHWNPDPNNGANVGSCTPLLTLDPVPVPHRSSSASGYFAPAVAARENLLVLLNAQASRVLLSKEDGGMRATTVAFSKEGTEFEVKGVKKDVILCAGAFQTPQILELSGVGNASHLAKHGITPLIDLVGVGENLQDHFCVQSIVEIDDKYETFDVLSDPQQLKEHERKFAAGEDSLLAMVPAESFFFIPLDKLKLDDDDEGNERTTAHLENLHRTSIVAWAGKQPNAKLHRGLLKQYALQEKWIRKDNHAQGEILTFVGHTPTPTALPAPGKRYITFTSTLLHPVSRGSVHISSLSPQAQPDLNPNILGAEFDFQMLAHILKFTIGKLATTMPFGGDVKGFVMPPEGTAKNVLGKQGILDSEQVSQEEKTDEAGRAIEEYLKKWVRTLFHPLGTAAMLPFEDGGVVNPELLVYGTNNLRVADASIIPLQTTSHTLTMVHAIAERAAEILKG